MIESLSTKTLYEICTKDKLLPEDVTYKEFFTIAKEFNRQISREIIGGYEFQSPIGTFSIVKIRRGCKVIDWKLSLINKQKLIDDGRTPYDKIKAPHGEFWFVYRTEGIRFKWLWKRVKDVKKWFAFLPCIANKRLLGKIVTIKKELQTDNYKFTTSFDYVTTPQDYIKPTHSFQDFSNLQTPGV